MELNKPEVIAMAGILVSVIVVLWGVFLKYINRDKKDLDACRELHRQSNAQLVELNGKYQYLQGRMDGVEKLSLSVIKEIRRHNKSKFGG